MGLTKVCPRCRVELPTDHFYRNRGRRDGLDTYCKPCSATYTTQRRDPLKHKQQNITNARKRRVALIMSMGGCCACCGETTYEFLQFDHINNNGAAHRRELGKKSISIVDIRRRIEEFQVLCANCNFSKGMHGTCPHTLVVAA